MTQPRIQFRAALLAMLVVTSVFAGTMALAGLAAADGTASSNDNASAQAAIQADSAKSLTLSWFRGVGEDSYDGDPAPPNEYDGMDSDGAKFFANAEGDGHLRVDNSTAKNPNGRWDKIVLHVETSGVSELNPGDDNIVTDSFVASDSWNLEVTQANGAKTLDLSRSTDGVVIVADTEVEEDDYVMDGEPDTGVYVLIDPNNATLFADGQETSFATGEEYEATFDINGETASTTFSTVEGTVNLEGSYSPANTFGQEFTGTSSLAAGSELEMVVEFENGDTMSTEAEVEGNLEAGGDSKGTIPEGSVTGVFDLTDMEGRSFTLTVYAPGTGEDGLDEDERVMVAESSGSVRDVIDPNYTLPTAQVTQPKVYGLAFGIEDYTTPSQIAESVGDGEVGQDHTVARSVEGTGQWDGMWLHFETSANVFEAINKAPGQNLTAKFLNSGLSLTVEQTNGDKRLDLSRNSSGVLVIPDPGASDQRLYNETTQGMFFWIDLNQATLYDGNGNPVEPESGDEYEATLSIETESGTPSATTTFRLVEGETWFVQDDQRVDQELRIARSESAQVTIGSTLAAGTEMGVRIEANDRDFTTEKGGSALEGTGSIRGGDIAGSEPNGYVTFTFDTSGLEVGDELTVYALVWEDPPDEYGPPLTVAEIDAVIAAPSSASGSISDQSGDGSTVTVDQVELSDGGFVAVHRGGPTGQIVGVSDYLEGGSHSDLEIALDSAIEEDTQVTLTVHLDTNDNQEFDFPQADDPYRVEGNIVTASGQYTVEAESTPTPTAMDDGATATDTAETTSPGFGLIVAMLALLAAALIARRRD